MNKPHWLKLALFCGLAALILVVDRNRQPSYYGKPLSFWIREAVYSRATQQSRQPINSPAAVTVVREAGTNAIPVLIKFLNIKDTVWSQTYAAIFQKLPAVVQNRLSVPLITREARRFASNYMSEFGAAAKPAVPILIQMLKEKDSESKILAAIPLGSIGPEAKAAVPDLLRLLQGTDLSLRPIAAESLGQIHAEPQIVGPALAAALRDTDPSVRASAANALKYFPEVARQLIPTFIELLRDPNAAVHSTAACTLAAIGSLPEELIPSVVAAMKDHYVEFHRAETNNTAIVGMNSVPSAASEDSYVRERGLQCILGIVPTVEALLPALAEVAKDKAEPIRSVANSALERIGPAAIPALVDATESESEMARLSAFHTLTNIAFNKIHLHARMIIPALIARLNDSNRQLRREAAEALGRIGPEAKIALPKLTELTNQGSTEFRSAVAEAIRRINSSETPN